MSIIIFLTLSGREQIDSVESRGIPRDIVASDRVCDQ